LESTVRSPVSREFKAGFTTNSVGEVATAALASSAAKSLVISSSVLDEPEDDIVTVCDILRWGARRLAQRVAPVNPDEIRCVCVCVRVVCVCVRVVCVCVCVW
jgi:hypothetical protein